MNLLWMQPYHVNVNVIIKVSFSSILLNFLLYIDYLKVRQIDSGITVEEMIAIENDVSVEEMIAMKNDISVEEVKMFFLFFN